ncbi:MAG TPA: pitrilysin family protein [Thermosynechococcaceae cyanobacterium]
MSQLPVRSSQSLQRTKILTLVFCFAVVPLILLGLAIAPATATPAKFYRDLTFGPIPEIKLPDYSRFQLSNGLVVYLMEDHELPLVSGTALIRTGDRWEPAEQVGLAELVGTVQRSGGTVRRSADEINEFLEQRAAEIETGIGESSGSASFNTLTENLPEVFDLFAEIIREPAFPDDKLALAKTQIRGGIARRNDNPSSIAGREFRKLIYGSSSPYARTVEYATIDPISRTDLVRFHQQYYRPDKLLLGIVGDFDSKTMRSQIESKLGNWTVDRQPWPSLPSVAQAQRSGVFLINQPQLTQSNIQIGHLGGVVSSPDYPALSVMNQVLNGFGGRLFNQVRSRQGLAYSVYGTWQPQYDYPGVFVAGGQTRSDATVPFIQSIQAEIEKIRTTPISATELKYAQDLVLNSFIFNFQDPSQTLSRLLRDDYFDYPSDFIFRYRKGVEATTIADVQRVAQTYLQPENLVTLVVGNEAAIQPALTDLGGKVSKIDVTIPPAKPS